MAEFILARKSRNAMSSVTHVVLNIALAVALVLVTVLSGSPALGIILVLISKWRIFAVRRRYLWLNIKSNLVDIIVGISIVLLSYYAGTEILPVHIILMAVGVLWFLVIKPMSSERATLIQSVIAVFLGISATTIMTASLDPVFAAVFAFLIGFAASRHVLAQISDDGYSLTTLVCGLIFAEIAVLCHYWEIIYEFNTPIETGIQIPQAAIILTIFAFMYNYARQTMVRREDDFKIRDIIGPVAFGTVMIAIIVFGFSNPIFNI